MRLSDAERRRMEKRRGERIVEVERMNQQLVGFNCHVVLSTFGNSVTLTHLDFRDEDPLSSNDYVALEVLSGEEFDEMTLADSSSVVNMALAMNKAVKRLQPIIEEQAVKGFKRKFAELMS